MKRFLSLLLLACLCLTLAACSADAGHGTTVSQSQTVNEVLQQNSQTQAPAETSAKDDAPEATPEAKATLAPDAGTTPAIDIDLTTMNATMVYSEVYQMLTEPDQFCGKIIRMRGTAGMVPGDGRNYYTCVIKDATACCANGLEYVLQEGYKYPNEGEIITIIGEYETYEEDDLTYCQLKDARIDR